VGELEAAAHCGLEKDHVGGGGIFPLARSQLDGIESDLLHRSSQERPYVGRRLGDEDPGHGLHNAWPVRQFAVESGMEPV
jgi:hypothetical protein